jgi:hypothetical protein
MTPGSGHLYGHTYAVTCITIIDTFILHIHTNDAYYYDTHIPLSGGSLRVRAVRAVAETAGLPLRQGEAEPQNPPHGPVSLA